MQSRSRRFRVAVAGLVACSVVALAGLASPAYAAPMRATCEPEIALSVEATAAYDYAEARYLDGIISNDSTVNVSCPVVKVTWLEDDAERVETGVAARRRNGPRRLDGIPHVMARKRAQHVDRCCHRRRLPDRPDRASAARR